MGTALLPNNAFLLHLASSENEVTKALEVVTTEADTRQNLVFLCQCVHAGQDRLTGGNNTTLRTTVLHRLRVSPSDNTNVRP